MQPLGDKVITKQTELTIKGQPGKRVIKMELQQSQNNQDINGEVKKETFKVIKFTINPKTGNKTFSNEERQAKTTPLQKSKFQLVHKINLK